APRARGRLPPVQLQGLVVQVEQAFLAQPRFAARRPAQRFGVRLGLGFAQVVRLAVVEAAQWRFHVSLGGGRRVLVVTVLQLPGRALVLFVAQQCLGPGFVMRGLVSAGQGLIVETLGALWGALEREELLRQLL